MARARLVVLFAVVALTAVGPALAQQPSATQADLAKQAQNPIGNLISLTFKDAVNLDMGPYGRNQNVFEIKPVIPFGLGAVNLITRTIVPILYRPDISAETGGTAGLGDINTTFFFGPSAASSVTWAVGPVVYFPAATDESLGSGKWSMGPSAIVIAKPGPTVIGALVSNAWSFAGDDEAADVNSFMLQPIFNYNLPRQWYLTSVPTITANWEAEDGNKWTVPIGGGFGKLFRIGSQAFNGSLQAFYNVERPEPTAQRPIGGLPVEESSGAAWTIRVQLQLLFPR